ncbi:unnamed protein product [Linum tenue]|uniref:ARID domain-containing protein n=1 Tax=Linum tenue TaxID=586396 RepID=A0AAV0Q0L6_9ROSI|nr:unnamed protein product [Linum tenue]
MAGWSMLANGPCLGGVDVNHKQKMVVKHAVNDIVVVGNNPNDDDVKLRKLFDEALSVFHDLGYNNGKCIKPIQVLLDDVQSVDLFKLFCVVGKRGGFDLVNGWWHFVMGELRMDPKYSGCIKLVYYKYLYNLERRLTKSYSYCEQGSDSDDFSLVLEAKFRSFLSYQNGKKGKKDGRVVSLEHKKSGKSISKDGYQSRCNDDDENVSGKYNVGGDDSLDRGTSHAYYLAQKESRKRKRVSVSEMLSWMVRVAACPEAVISKSNHTMKDNDLKAMAISVRDFLLKRRPLDSNDFQSCSKNQQNLHPSMYDDMKVDQAVENSRCRERQMASGKCHSSCSCCIHGGSADDDKPKTNYADSLPITKVTVPLKDKHVPVRVGSRFQAKVPKWTGEVYESDSKWLGTKLWPLEEVDSISKVQMNTVGKGRPDSCSCLVPGSVVCVRFHTAERRMKLKRELGPAFFHSGFHHMGEEVSLSWTAEEEKRFKDMVRHNPPSQERCFWDYAHRYFPGKTKRELVSYYFNVFQLQRRSYQNRVIPKEIDSDDDEKQFGSFTDGFGYHAIKVHGTDTEICSVNHQCNEYP